MNIIKNIPKDLSSAYIGSGYHTQFLGNSVHFLHQSRNEWSHKIWKMKIVKWFGNRRVSVCQWEIQKPFISVLGVLSKLYSRWISLLDIRLSSVYTVHTISISFIFIALCAFCCCDQRFASSSQTFRWTVVLYRIPFTIHYYTRLN